MTIRLANGGDTEAVAGFMGKAHDASPLSQYIGFSNEKARTYFLHQLSSADTLCLVHEADGVVRGAFIALAVDHPMSPFRIAVEAVCFLDPEFRGHAWLKIKRWFEAWAKEQRCDLTSLSSKQDSRFTSAIERNGYRLVESHFVKAV